MASVGSFSGLASGIQWKDMIEQIMRLETARRVTPLRNRVSDQEGRINAWNRFQGLASKLTSSANALKDGGAFSGFKADATVGLSGRALLSASAGPTAAAGSYRVEVIELARAEKVAGSSSSSATDALGLDGQFFVNGRAVTIAAGDSLTAIRDKINGVNSGATPSGVSATILSTSSTSHTLMLTASQTGSRGIELVDSANSGGVLQSLGVLSSARSANTAAGNPAQAQSQRFTSTTTTLASLLGVSPQPAVTTVEIGGRKVTVDLANDTLISLMNKVAAEGVSASLVEEAVGGRTTHRLNVQGAVTADAAAADPSVSQRVVELLGFQKAGRGNVVAQGTDARFRVDGFNMTRRSNTVTDAIAGVTLNLLATDAAQRTSRIEGTTDLAILNDPKSIDAGRYGVTFASTTTSTRDVTDDSADLAVTSSTGVADGTYAVELTTAVNRTDSASTPWLDVTNAPASWAAGTYAVDGTVTRSATASSALLTAKAAGVNVAAGTYSVDLAVSRTATASTANLSATAAGSSIAAGTYNVQATFTRSASTTLANTTVLAANSSVAAGTHNVAITQAATRSSAVGVANTTYTGNTGDFMDIRDNVTGVLSRYSLTSGQTLDTTVSGLNAMFSANGMRMTAVNDAGKLKLEHQDYGAGALSSFTVTNNHQRVTNSYGIGSGSPGTTYANGVNVAGTIGGVTATGSGQTLSGAGAYTGLNLRYTGSAAASGTVTVTDSITSATVGGQAATWNAATQTLTTAAGLGVRYTGAFTANNLGASTTTALGSVTLTDTITGGSLGGQGATWDASTRTLTDANGLAVEYTGTTPAGSLAGPISTTAGNVTIADALTGGTIGGQSATWSQAAGTFTTADGLTVSYTGTTPRGVLGTPTGAALGNITLTDTTEISGGTIGGEAATWDAATGTLTANAGTRGAGLSVAYTGAVASGPVGTVTVKTTDVVTVDGVTIGGETAQWDAATKTIRGSAGSRFEGLSLTYSGTNPSGYVGDLVVEGEIGVDLTVRRDVDAAVNKVKEFATAYSDLRAFAQSQRTGNGPLATDGTLRAAVANITNQLLSEVSGLTGAFNRTAQVGVALTREGRLDVDTARLQSLIETNSNDVESFFRKFGEQVHNTASRIDRATTGTVATQVDSLNRSIDRLNSRVLRAEAMLDVRRERLTKEFSAMEEALGKIQSQGSWLFSQLGGLQQR